MIVSGGFRAGICWIDRSSAALDQEFAKCVLNIGIGVFGPENFLPVGLILGEDERRWLPVRPRARVKLEAAQCFVIGDQTVLGFHFNNRLLAAIFVGTFPGPGVAKPKGRQQMETSGLGAAIGHGDANQNIIRRSLGIFGKDIKVPAILENAGIGQFEFRLLAAAPPIFFHQLHVGKFRLRIFVERLEVGMRRRRIQVEITLLYILAVIALRTGETKEPLFQNRIAPIPERQREAKPAFTIRDAEQSILSPAIGPAARVLEGKILPAISISRVVLAHRAPLALRQIRPPALPILDPLCILGQALIFGAYRISVFAHVRVNSDWLRAMVIRWCEHCTFKR